MPRQRGDQHWTRKRLAAGLPAGNLHRRKVTDFVVAGGGTVYLLIPKTDAARAWRNDNLPGDVQMLGNGIAVEHRYISDILDGIKNDGLTITGVRP